MGYFTQIWLQDMFRLAHWLKFLLVLVSNECQSVLSMSAGGEAQNLGKAGAGMWHLGI